MNHQPTAARPRALARRLFPSLAIVIAGLLASAAFAQSNSTSKTCRRLQDTQYWRVSFQIAPMPSPEPARTQQALSGFVVNSSQNADGTTTVDIERSGGSDNETNETPDQDDIKVDTSKQRLYFLEGEMGDDAVGIDTHLNDEAVVLTDLNGCILH